MDTFCETLERKNLIFVKNAYVNTMRIAGPEAAVVPSPQARPRLQACRSYRCRAYSTVSTVHNRVIASRGLKSCRLL